MSLPTAAALVTFARALAAKAKGYGERSINGKSQRGPDYWDCVGFVRGVLLTLAPSLWPSKRGGEDSWTVSNFMYWWTHLKLGAVLGAVVALAGDIVIFGANEHIGIADGRGNVISAANTRDGVCVLPIASFRPKLTHVLRTGLAQGAPAATAPAPKASGPATYTVRVGDTLRSIALAHGTDPRTLLRLNAPKYNLSDAAGSSLSQRVQPSWVLTIPGR